MRAMAAIIPSGAVIGRPWSKAGAHDVAVRQRGRFGKAVDPVCESMPPMSETLLQSDGALIRANLAYPERDLRDRHRRQSEFRVAPNEPGDNGGIGRFAERL